MSKIAQAIDISNATNRSVSGEFINFENDERYYAINNVDKMTPFFISVVSDSDHWLFISSHGGLTAGRVSPETALFPYLSVDKIHESATHTGSKTILRVKNNSGTVNWEPFNQEHNNRFDISRHLYKNTLGNKICFEEVNHDLELTFRYSWLSSDSFGFVRQCEIQNSSGRTIEIDLLDGLQNVLPAGTPRLLQSSSSNLIDAYKWTELDVSTGLGIFTLNSGITDRPEPFESLKANTVFCLGLEDPDILISSLQLENFKRGERILAEDHKRGIRGAYFVSETLVLKSNSSKRWFIVANTEQSQNQVVALRSRLKNTEGLLEEIHTSIENGSDQLAKIMASADAFQLVSEENLAVHHYANVLFNVQRGGGFVDQYRVYAKDFVNTIQHFNQDVFKRNVLLLEKLRGTYEFSELLLIIKEQNDPSLERLCYEYLPISFGRRHGDPSRPWNQFAIKLKDNDGNQILSYQGNWRDIFQNWEALALSYPGFVENMIAKFVNASTIDGYNPYRITKEGIDWEIEDESDPWSFIGYWGDHQIIYLLKLLEQSYNFYPDRLGALLHRPIFCYANVPYRIKSFDSLIKNSKDTVVFDQNLANEIDQRVARMGADGKLILDSNREVYQVNLLEKLIVALLTKLSNFVVDGGIWLNTQRPEWNDANNALVGQGLSMVTLYYLRRYVKFLQDLLKTESRSVELSSEVNQWLENTVDCVASLTKDYKAPIDDETRFHVLSQLGNAACKYRETVYSQNGFSSKVDCDIDVFKKLLGSCADVIDASILHNRRVDGMYEAYNTVDYTNEKAAIDNLYLMLEGQVAALSSGTIPPDEAVTVIEQMFTSSLYRDDQKSFILYPDRSLPGFLNKNLIDADKIKSIALTRELLRDHNDSIIANDCDGNLRFNADLSNRNQLNRALDLLKNDYQSESFESDCIAINHLYEEVFNHKSFTGRSGGMFGFEGLGSIYWHMVSKLLLVVQENYFKALDDGESELTLKKLGDLYYRVREGIGFNKTPQEYGAFPTDPYSHTPKHAGARQPGMTGQVKEEVLTRFGELGICVIGGIVSFRPRLLRKREFASSDLNFKYLDLNNSWKNINVAKGCLAYTWCQIPVVYHLHSSNLNSIKVVRSNGLEDEFQSLSLSKEDSSTLFDRTGLIKQIDISIGSEELFGE